MNLFDWAVLGKAKYGGEVYDNDFIVSTFQEVFPRAVVEEHLITKEEITRSIDDNTKTLLVGTGEYGIVKVSKDAMGFCKRKGIDVVAKPTKEIIEEYNKRMTKKGRKPGITVIVHVSC